MVKLRELTECERLAVKHLRLSGLSFAEIGKQIGCSKSTAFNVYKSLNQWMYRETEEKRSPQKISGAGGALYMQGSKEVAILFVGRN